MQILNIDKLSFRKLCDSKLAGLHAFYNMAISLSQKKGKKLKKKTLCHLLWKKFKCLKAVEPVLGDSLPFTN